MSHERPQSFEIPHVAFPKNPKKINILGFEVYKYIGPDQMDKFIEVLSDRNNLRDYDAVLVNLWGGLELFKDLRRLQNYPKWPYMAKIARTDLGVREVFPIDNNLKRKKVLIVDDILDRGWTLQEMFRHVGPDSRAVVAVTKIGIKGQILDPRVDSAVSVDDRWLGGKGMNIGYPGEEQLFRQYRGIVVKP